MAFFFLQGCYNLERGRISDIHMIFDGPDSESCINLDETLAQVYAGQEKLRDATEEDDKPAFREALRNLLEYMIEFETAVKCNTYNHMNPEVHTECERRVALMNNTLLEMAEACDCMDVCI